MAPYKGKEVRSICRDITVLTGPLPELPLPDN
jgi:hypothetical protein